MPRHHYGVPQHHKRHIVQTHKDSKTGSTVVDKVIETDEDPVLEYAHALVREFLTNKGYQRTLEAFHADLEAAGRPAASVDCWYEVMHALNYPGLVRYNRELGGLENDSTLEIFTRYLCDTRRSGGSRGSREREARLMAAEQVHAEQQALRARQGKVERRLRAKSGMLSPMEKAQVLGDVTSEELYNLSIGTRLHMGRFGPSATLRRKHKEILESRSTSALPRSLTLESPKRSQRKKRTSATSQPTPVAALSSAMQRKPARKPTGPAANRRSPKGVTPLSSPTDADGTGAETGAAEGETLASSPPPLRSVSKEHWIPMSNRVRMLQRDMRVAKLNVDRQAQWERDMQRSANRLEPREREMVMERYAGKRSKECALCEHKFAAVNLPMEVTYKAVMDLRESAFGVDIPANPRLRMVPRCYDKVHICRFCSQFFETTELYRPLVRKAKETADEDFEIAPAFFRSQ